MRIQRNQISVLALSAAAFLAVSAGGARAQSAGTLHSQLNSLQEQINAINAKLEQVNAQAAQQAAVAQQQAQVAQEQAQVSKQQLLSSSAGAWYADTTAGMSPLFQTKNGSSFTIGGQVEVDTGLGNTPESGTTKNPGGFSAATQFRRIEFQAVGTYHYNWVYKVEEDWTATNTPLGGLLDVYFGYRGKTGPFTTVALVGNQHVPFGFQTPSNSTLYLENDMGNNLFQDNRELGVSGMTYNNNWNFWYGAFSTNVGAVCKGATAKTSLVPGACFNAGSTSSTTALRGQWTASEVAAYNVFNTPGHLLSLRDSVEYNRFNGNQTTNNNNPSLSTFPDVSVAGEKFVNTGALGIQGELVESPRIDFEDNRLNLAAAWYYATTQSNSEVSATDPRRMTPSFSSWDLEADYFLTDDHLPFESGIGGGSSYVPVRVHHPVGEGGLGALELVGRIDEANLSAAKYGIYGGNETNITVGTVWSPISAMRIDFNYVHTLPIGGASVSGLTAFDTNPTANPKSSTGALPTANAFKGRTSDLIALRLEVMF
jgi:phosphate-selective porin